MKYYPLLLFLFTLSCQPSRPVVAVANNRANTLIVGLPNPITVAVENVNDKDIRLESDALTFLKGGRGKYLAEAKKVGRAEVVVFRKNKAIDTLYFRVKRLPDPVTRLGRKKSGTMSAAEFKAQGGILAQIENFDIDANCKVDGYLVAHVPLGKDPVEVENIGGRFEEKTKILMNKAQSRDVYYFTNVKCRCPGDEFGRRISDVVIRIK